MNSGYWSEQWHSKIPRDELIFKVVKDVCLAGLTWTLLETLEVCCGHHAFLPSGFLAAQEIEIVWDKDNVGQTCLFSKQFSSWGKGANCELITALISIGSIKQVSKCVKYKCVRRKMEIRAVVCFRENCRLYLSHGEICPVCGCLGILHVKTF